MEKYTLKDLAIHYGFASSYFSVMKNTNQEKFNFVFSFDENKKRSLEKYIEFVSSVISNMEKVLFSFDKKHDYGVWITKLDLTNIKNLTSVYCSDERAIFKYREEEEYIGLKFNSLQKWLKIIEQFKVRKYAWVNTHKQTECNYT